MVDLQGEILQEKMGSGLTSSQNSDKMEKSENR